MSATLTLDQLHAIAHKAEVENENVWADLQHAEQTVIVLRHKQQVAALAALRAQIALDAAKEKLS